MVMANSGKKNMFRHQTERDKGISVFVFKMRTQMYAGNDYFMCEQFNTVPSKTYSTAILYW